METTLLILNMLGVAANFHLYQQKHRFVNMAFGVLNCTAVVIILLQHTVKGA